MRDVFKQDGIRLEWQLPLYCKNVKGLTVTDYNYLE